MTATAERAALVLQDWYRPDLMAVVAVGDFDPARDRGADQATLLGDSEGGQPAPRTVAGDPCRTTRRR